MRDSDFETPPRQLWAGDIIYYNHEQKEKGKALVQMHIDFAQYSRYFFKLLSIASEHRMMA